MLLTSAGRPRKASSIRAILPRNAEKEVSRHRNSTASWLRLDPYDMKRTSSSSRWVMRRPSSTHSTSWATGMLATSEGSAL